MGEDAPDGGDTGTMDAALGLARGAVDLRTHRSEWHAAYANEADRLRGLLGDRLRGVEHVGSTAVEGLPAKPVVDILGLVADIGTARELVASLTDAGYEHRPGDVSGRAFLAKGPPSSRTHYLSLAPVGGRVHREQVAFRDYLRTNPETAARYARLKRELAARYPEDRDRYTAAKEPFVADVLETALAAGYGPEPRER
jgi:GrpB-like predicted nucleotidyltransferase (UPF0157 family)